MEYGVENTVTYLAWDTANNGGKTGDVGNHTLRWVKDGTSAAPANAPSEVDATNAPGLYKLTLTAAECQCANGTLGGKSSTPGVVIIPQQFAPTRLTAERGEKIDLLGHTDYGLAKLMRTGADGDTGKTLSDQLDALGAGTTGTDHTLTITDAQANPIDGVAVHLTTTISRTPAAHGPKHTDAMGRVTFSLDPGTYYVWRQRAGYDFTQPNEQVIDDENKIVVT